MARKEKAAWWLLTLMGIALMVTGIAGIVKSNSRIQVVPAAGDTQRFLDNGQQIKAYRIHRVVWAFRIGLVEPRESGGSMLSGDDMAPLLVDDDYIEKAEAMAKGVGLELNNGYYVIYPNEDGSDYVTWCPADEFDKGSTGL